MGHHNHHHHHHHMLSLIHWYDGGSGSKKEGGGGGGGGMVQLPPKGCMAIRVGQKEEERERFVVPVVYLNHPLFIGLLKEAEEEYGFDHKGAITIPCHLDQFRHVRRIIDRDTTADHHHHHHHFHLPCFKA